jgi:hypothetical protein
MGRRLTLHAILLSTVAASFVLPAAAAPKLPSGAKTITAIAPSGAKEVIGHVTFIADGDGAKIDVAMDGAKFKDEFLSMRPFRCISGTKRMLCHLEYPYATAKRITATDLVDLEYALMFLWRTYDKVSIDAWNGLYYKFKLNDDGSLSGELHEADYNPLASPPPAGVTRPITHNDLTKAESGQHLYDRIEIK